TGKTTVLVSYILEAIQRHQKLLVCAPSNVAVDNLLERVTAVGGISNVVRIGHPARVEKGLE
ncbi:dna-binding protein smubp-2, putative, partial [Perkinsus marinus ATCC 50983]